MKVVVVGGGVLGLSSAFELSALGHDVTVVDAGAVGAGASAGNAGWVTPFLAVPRAAPGAVLDAVRSVTSIEGPARVHPHAEAAFASWVMLFLRASSQRRSARTTSALQAISRHAHAHVDNLLERGITFEHHADGLAVVFKEAHSLRRFARLASQMRGRGYVGDISLYRGSEIAAFDPAIRRDVAGVMHLETERHVRPETLTDGLAKAILDRGGAVIEHDRVERIEEYVGGRWVVTTAAGKQLVPDRVVVAAGFQTRGLLEAQGVHVPLEAAKGTSMTAYGEGLVPAQPLKLYEDMVACSPYGQAIRLSGTFDVAQRDFTLNRARLDMVVRNGLSYLENWRPTEVEVEWVGHRPTAADDAPIIGPVPHRPGLYLATGHGTLGITLGPVTGALVAREITNEEDEPLLAPFRLTRFRRRRGKAA